MSILIGNTFLNNTGINVFQQTKSYKDYDLYIDFTKSLKDQVSKALFPAANYDTTHSNLINGELVEYGVDEYARDDDGRVLTCGGYSQYAPYNRDTSQWSGSGPWTVTTESLDTGTYMIETFVDGATVSISAGTATIDGVASATYGSADTFEVTVSGTVVITSDTADPLSHLTKSEYHLPFVPNDTAGSIAVSATYADDNAGDEYGPRLAFEDIPGAVNALDGVADGDELIINGGFDSYESWVTNTIIEDGLVKFVVVSGAMNYIYQTGCNLYAGKTYEITIDAVRISGTGSIGLCIGAGNNPYEQIGVYSGITVARITPNDLMINLGIKRVTTSGDYAWHINSFSVKEISPAQGEIEQKVRFGFDYNTPVVSTVVANLFAPNDNSARGLYAQITNGNIKGHDGSLFAYVEPNYRSGKTYTVKLKYGPHTGYGDALKMKLVTTDGITTWESDLVDFDGSFDPADFLFFGYKNPYPIWHESLKFRKEVTW